MKVFVNTSSGNKITFEVDQLNTIKNIKDMLETKMKLPVKNQVLKFGNKQLFDHETVRDCHITNKEINLIAVYECPKCHQYVDMDNMCILPCREGHRICWNCLLIRIQNSQSNCSMIGKECSYNHYLCEQCNENFHFPHNNNNNVLKLRDASDIEKRSLLERSSENEFRRMTNQCGETISELKNTRNAVEKQIEASKVAATCGNVAAAVGIMAAPATFGLSLGLTAYGCKKSYDESVVRLKLTENTDKSIKRKVHNMIQMLRDLFDTVHQYNILTALHSLYDKLQGIVKVPPCAQIQDGIFRLSMLDRGINQSEHYRLPVTNIRKVLEQLYETLEELIPLIEFIRTSVQETFTDKKSQSKISQAIQNAIIELEKIKEMRLNDLIDR